MSGRAINAVLLAAAFPLAGQAQTAPESDWSFHAQSTYVDQWHYGFPAEYSGPNSFSSREESAVTFSISLYLGRRLWPGAEVYYNPEIFQGYGLSRTYGIAAFPNGEAIKAGFPQLHYNTSRLFLRQTWGFGGGKESVEDEANHLAEPVDADRLVITVGKMASNDLFDDNAYSHDSRNQFLNWDLWESAAWDAPGDEVGFTGGFVAEWHAHGDTLRYGAFMVPAEANGARLDHHLDQAMGQIAQYDIAYSLAGGRSGTFRPFVYLNRTHAGLYSEADAQAHPDIASTRAYRFKKGLGLSWDQSLSASLGAFVRLSADDGATESYDYTEADRALAAGLSLKGSAWSRPDDTVGLAAGADGLASDHRRYLEEGGVGFVLGDGALHYGPEQILEAYYSVALFRRFRLSPDWQYIERPGYNRDRGGVAVYAVRAHVEF